MKIEYVVEYVAWNNRLQWHRKKKVFTDNLDAHEFIREANEKQSHTFTPVGRGAFLKSIVLTNDDVVDPLFADLD